MAYAGTYPQQNTPSGTTIGHLSGGGTFGPWSATTANMDPAFVYNLANQNYQSAMQALMAQGYLNASVSPATVFLDQSGFPNPNPLGFGPRIKDLGPRTPTIQERLQESQLAFERDRLAQERELFGGESPAERIASQDRAFQQQKFNTLFELLSGQLGDSGTDPQAGPATQGPYVPISVSKGPDIATDPVFGSHMIQQMKNEARARAAAQADTAIRSAGNRAAAQGFAGESPLLQALQANLGFQGRALGEQEAFAAAREAAAANADQILRSQMASNAAHTDYERNRIASFQAATGARNAVLAMLAGLA